MSVFFGPEAIEIIPPQGKPTSLSDQGLTEFVAKAEGIFGIGLESDDIASDYSLHKAQFPQIEKPRRANHAEKQIPLWYGYNIPHEATPGLRGWVVMNSPFILDTWAREILPVSHPNTCFGIESVSMISGKPDALMAKWGEITQRKVFGLHWNELIKTSGKRIQSGQRFLDGLAAKGAEGREGVFMVTLRVTDLELAKSICVKAGAVPTRCNSRDGFLVSAEFTGGPTLRFVRAAWNRYLPVTNGNYPYLRRSDKFRPLGGAFSSTLEEGFGDNWKY